MTRPTGARPASLAGAFVGASGTLESLGYNPAGLADLPRPSIATWHQHRLGLETLAASLAYGLPTRAGAFALAVTAFDAGPVELVDLDNNAREVSAQKDFVYSAAYALAPGTGRLSAGIAGKLFQSTLAETATASSYLVDLGAAYRLPGGWRAGLAVRNLGEDIGYLSASDPPPTTIPSSTMATWSCREIC